MQRYLQTYILSQECNPLFNYRWKKKDLIIIKTNSYVEKYIPRMKTKKENNNQDEYEIDVITKWCFSGSVAGLSRAC